MMFLLFVFFLVHTTIISGEECPEEKKVGDTCYTRVAMTDTHKYGCMENCTYKKTLGSDTGLYCFKTGPLHVAECGESPYPISGYIPEYTCGNSDVVPYCFECGDTRADCEGEIIINPSDCVLASNGTCVPRSSDILCGSGMEMPYCSWCGNTEPECEGDIFPSDCILDNGTCIRRWFEIDIGIFMNSLEQSFIELETNSSAEIVSPSMDSCSFLGQPICIFWAGIVVFDCKHCGLNDDCLKTCLKEKICTIPSKCLPGGACYNFVLDKIEKLLKTLHFPSIVIEIIIIYLKQLSC